MLWLEAEMKLRCMVSAEDSNNSVVFAKPFQGNHRPATYFECSHRHFCGAPINPASMNFLYLATDHGPAWMP